MPNMMKTPAQEPAEKGVTMLLTADEERVGMRYTSAELQRKQVGWRGSSPAVSSPQHQRTHALEGDEVVGDELDALELGLLDPQLQGEVEVAAVQVAGDAHAAAVVLERASAGHRAHFVAGQFFESTRRHLAKLGAWGIGRGFSSGFSQCFPN